MDGRRKIQVKEFKGKLYVDIREFYYVNRELKPTKKGNKKYNTFVGVFLPIDSWNKLLDLKDKVSSAIKAQKKK